MAQIGIALENRDHVIDFEDGETSSSSWALLKQEPYYSNKDIEILHSIVSAAQQKFNDSRCPKPLPAAVLFEAYDNVLPTFGIDPESDHHLSALVFRIGGESGNGTLSEKFHRLMNRMGILVEVDDGGGTMPDHCSSSESPQGLLKNPVLQVLKTHSPSKKHGASVRNEHLSDLSAEAAGSDSGSRSYVMSDIQVTHNDKRMLSVTHGALKTEEQCKDTYAKKVRSDYKIKFHNTLNPSQKSAAGVRSNIKHWNSQKQSIVSVIDRWRNIASGKIFTEETYRSNQMPNHDNGKLLKPINTASMARALSMIEGNRSLEHPSLETEAHNWAILDDDVFFLRAVRARQIYLASRIFSRWVDETARRLERDSVARRHMVRFRCFSSWVQSPYSKVPTVRRLKAALAFQKLQRAVGCHEAQLELAASVITAARISRKALQLLNLWFSCASCKLYIDSTKQLIKSGLIHNWLGQIHIITDIESKLVGSSHHSRAICLAARWIAGMINQKLKARSAQKLATTRKCLRWLRTWRIVADVGRQAESCSQVLAVDQCVQCLDNWQLRTRAEVFRWKCEYTSATRFMNAWAGMHLRCSALKVLSVSSARSRSSTKLTHCLKDLIQTQLKLDVLSRRAQWYIYATYLLEQFESVVRRRKHQMKLVVRRHLMMRYTQVSSQRRQRSFYTGLHRWHMRLSDTRSLERSMAEYQASSNVNRKQAVYMLWRRHAIQNSISRAGALSYRRQMFLEEWQNHAHSNQQQLRGAAQLWSAEQQRQFLKTWMISTLQMSGQAHSAGMVQNRHQRDSRNRTFQRWRQITSLSQPVGSTHAFQSPATAGLKSSHKPSWRQSRRQKLFRQLDYDQGTFSPIQTPSRPKGLLFPTTQAPPLRFLDPVSEVERQSLASRSVVSRIGGVSTTTPKVPVPVYMQPSSHTQSLWAGKQRQHSPVKSDRARPTGGSHVSHTTNSVISATRP